MTTARIHPLPAVLGLAGALLVGAAELLPAKDRQYDADTFEWHPDRAPEGPVLVVVSLSTQTAHVYRNGVRIGRCLVSSGKPGHSTPTGVFHILNKDKDHRSKTYGNAPMPYSERLTWDGVALHAGALPGYPSSHGCIHLPYEFSKVLFGITHTGTTVVVTNDKAEPYVSGDHRAPITGNAGHLFGADTRWTWTPDKANEGPVSMVVSEFDSRLYVLRNGVPIGEAPIEVTSEGRRIKGTQAFTLLTKTNDVDDHFSPGRFRSIWSRVGGSADDHAVRLEQFFHAPPDFVARVAPLVHPGTVLVVTNEPVSQRTRSTPNFTILAAGKLLDKAANEKPRE